MCEIKESGSSVVSQFERESRRCSSSCFLNLSKASSRSWAIRFTSLSADDSLPVSVRRILACSWCAAEYRSLSNSRRSVMMIIIRPGGQFPQDQASHCP